jgi:N-acetylneuraminic acid mutarotase
MTQKRFFYILILVCSISCKKTNESSITVSYIFPDSDGPGATIKIYGKDFGNNPSAASVYFNGVPGTVVSCSDSVMEVVIPNGATTGTLTIESGGHHGYKSSTYYTILTGSWVKKANFPGQSRIYASSFSINNIGYVVAGATSSWTDLADMYAYDPVADSWSKKASLPAAPRTEAFGITIGNKGYLIGGLAGQNDTVSVPFLPEVWEYDPSTDVWKQKNNLPGIPRINAAGFAIGNIAYYGLGYEGPGQIAQDWWHYDPATDIWTRKADFSYPPDAEYGFSIGGIGYLLVFGNYQNWYSYSESADQWTNKSTNPGYVEPYGLPVSVGNQGYYITGSGSSLTWVYDAASDNWSRKTSIPNSRGGAAGVSLNNNLYVGLGALNSYDTTVILANDWWEFQH